MGKDSGALIASAGEPDDEPDHNPDGNPDEPDSAAAGEPAGDTGDGLPTNLEGVLDFLAAKYCPHCGTRRPVDEAVCPTDGMALRDLSITTDCGRGATDSLTGGLLGTRLAEWMEGQAARAPSEDLFQIAGVVLGGKWRVEKLVGEGSFGAFFLGRHVTLGMRVGIKVLRKRFTHSKAGLRLFHNEAQRLSLLHHPGIVQVLDYGEEGDRPYLVMEYLTGTPLHRFLGFLGDKHPQSDASELGEGHLEPEFTLDDGVEVIRQVAEALIAAHRGVGVGEPLVHLDLKPEHIFLERIQGRWHVKVIDFGIAEIAAAPSDPGAEGTPARKPPRLHGTLPYMAPERWDGAVDPRCDLYSLGIVLYELVAGRKPFDIWDPEAMRILHTREKPTPPSRHRLLRSREPGLRDLDAIVLRLLEKDPARRPQSAEELAETLERWQRRPKRTPRERLARACVAPAVFLMLGLAAAWWGPWERISGVPKPEEPLLVGPAKAAQHSVYVAGMGYTRAWLAIAAGDVPRYLELPAVAAGGEVKVEVAYDQLLPFLPYSQHGSSGNLEAWVRVEGPLGRQLRSERFTIRVDADGPRVLKINDTAPPGEKKSLQLLKGARFRVEANEPLDVHRSRLKDPEQRATTPGRQATVSDLVFDLNAGQEKIVLELFDLAGNRTEREWPIVWTSDKAPSLVSPDDLRTSEPDPKVTLEWFEDPGDVTVTVRGEAQRLTVEEQGRRWRARCFVRFDPGRTGEQEEEVFVRVAPRGSAPPGEESFKVRYLRRDLLVRRSTVESEGDPPALEVTAGGELLKEELDWNLFVDWQGFPGEDVWNTRHRGSSLTLDAETVLRGNRGKFRVLATVKDAFGNESEAFRVSFPYGVEAPRIRKLGLADQAQPVIHHRECSEAEAQATIEIQFEVAYDWADELVPELWLDQRPPLGKKVVFVASEDHPGGLEVPSARLREILTVGTNPLFLILTDPETGTSAEESCILTYEEEPEVEVHVGEEAESGVPIAVTTSGPPPKEIVVEADGRTVPPSGGSGSYLVPVKPWGTTQIDVRVGFVDGCQRMESRWVSCDPREGWTYVFEVGPDETLALTYAGNGRWHTGLQEPATAHEAGNELGRLQGTLQAQPLLSGEPSVECRLPDIEELPAWNGAQPPADGGRQWVRQDETAEARAESVDALKGFHACAEWIGTCYVPRRDLAARRRCPYVIVVEVPEAVGKQLPRLAKSAEDGKEIHE
jgi:serine/threonine protein kinase